MMNPILYRILRPLIKILVSAVFRPKIIGWENIPRSGGVILAGNHTSYFDCVLLISTTKRTVHFLGKHTLLKGVKRVLFGGMGVIPVDRTKDKNPDAMKSSIEVLNKGGVIGIFPESTINKTSDVVMPFKMGAVKMASVTDSYIVPFAITGKYKIFKNELKITFDKPYKIRNNELENENKILMDKVILLLEGKQI